MSDDGIQDGVWDLMKRHLGYTDEEAEVFRNNPRNARVMATAPRMLGKTIVFTVIESRGCNSGHAVGTRFYFTGDGNLLTKMAPSKVCAFAMPVMTQMVYGIGELMYAGADPDTLCFNRAGCFDVGVMCGGWGRIILEASVMDREEARALYEKEKQS
jgi:uncharacterized repeat protein (TIGR04076 family)